MSADDPSMTGLEYSQPLAGLRAMITGSSGGIGRAMLLELARAGAAVLAHANTSFDAARTLAADITARGGKAQALRADLRAVNQLDELVEAAFQVWGGIDIWINNAGADLLTGEKPNLPFASKLEEVFQVDVRATMLLTRAVGARMQQAAGGSIINLGWDQAETGMAGDQAELYAAAKGAIMSFTRSAAVSLAPRVRVNCIAPGWIRTSWGEGASREWQERVVRETPLGRWGRPEDVARVARFLASRESEYLTGQIIRVNGGAVR